MIKVCLCNWKRFNLSPGYQEQLGDAETKIAQYSQEIVVLKEKLNGSHALQESVANQKDEIENLKREKNALDEKCHQVSLEDAFIFLFFRFFSSLFFSLLIR